MRSTLALGACLGALCPAAAAQDEPPPPPILREVKVETRDVFSRDAAKENLFYALFNALHATTREWVIEREVFVAKGEPIRDEQVEELERNLRRAGWFGAVETDLVPVQGDPAGPELVDLEIKTRDRFSLTAGASVSFFGGIDKFDAALNESNLFGTGKRLGFQYRDAADERRGVIRFTDPQLLGTWHVLNLSVGQTEEGDQYGIDLSRPTKHLADPWTYGIGGGHEVRDVDYFRAGDTVASIPEERTAGRLFFGGASGPRHLRTTLGVEFRGRDSAYEPAEGSDPGSVQVPPDTVELQLGPFLSVDWIDSFHKVQGLDAIDYVEDLTMEVSTALRLAAVRYDQVGADAEAQALAGLGMRTAVNPATGTYLTTELSGFVRFDDELRGWQGLAAVHAYQMSLPHQTLAASLRLDAGAETQGLEPQFTIGEDNGLRGYPAREFAGTRMLRLNFEDRIRTDLEVLSIHLGLVAFFDAAWVHGTDQGLSMSDAITAAGVGIRLGSSNLGGGSVLRIDFAFPLTKVDGEEYDFSVSVSPGQVFTFFGNQSQLTTEFGPTQG